MTTFYKRVSDLCMKQGITVNSLIVNLGMSKSNGKSWREGAVPQVSTMKRIAEYFGVDINYLMGKDEVSINTVQDNHGVIGKVTAPVTMTTVNSPADDAKSTLLDIYDQLDAIGKARLLLFADDLRNGKDA